MKDNLVSFSDGFIRLYCVTEFTITMFCLGNRTLLEETKKKYEKE